MAFTQQRRGARPQNNSRPSGGRSFGGGGGGRRGGGSRGPAKKYIHPSKFINKAVAKADEVVYESKHKFVDFPFGSELKHNIVSKGYETPSAIQDQAIPYIIEGRDVIGLANTGTGKTAAFLLPIIERQSGDRMLDMGFLPDIRQIVDAMPQERQTLFFSATITPEITALTKTFLKDPATVSVRTSETAEHVEQDVIEARDKTHKVDLLTELLQQDGYDKVLVFGETKFGVQRLSDHLHNSGIPSVAIHGNKNQSQRSKALKQFKDERVRVLVATDVAARGLDIPNVTHVINFDTPQTYEDYVHRIGRTGRGGASGRAHTFIDAR
ncbi:DEAD/DEAH box helicase [Candidatus Saccharibacteria bacterium]|nr:DEAD/DEAH box helicase [Candidatus Saccharibacteria bacterium]